MAEDIENTQKQKVILKKNSEPAAVSASQGQQTAEQKKVSASQVQPAAEQKPADRKSVV